MTSAEPTRWDDVDDVEPALAIVVGEPGGAMRGYIQEGELFVDNPSAKLGL